MQQSRTQVCKTHFFSALPFLAPGPLQAAPGVMRGLCPGYYSGLGGMPSVAPGRGGSARSLSHAEAQGAGGTRPALWVMPGWTLDTMAGLHGSLRPGLKDRLGEEKQLSSVPLPCAKPFKGHRLVDSDTRPAETRRDPQRRSPLPVYRWEKRCLQE